MDDYINKIKEIDQRIESRLVESKALGIQKLVGVGALTLASVIAATTLMKPSYQEASSIQQMVHFYSEKPDAQYGERLPELKPEDLLRLADGNNRYQYKDPFVHGEVVHVFYAREMHHDPLVTSPRFAINDSKEVDDFSKEWGSVQIDVKSDIAHLFQNVDTTLNVVRFDPSQAEALALKMQQQSLQPVNFDLVKQWVLLHEIAHGHALQDRMAPDARERVSDIAAVLSIAAMNKDILPRSVIDLSNQIAELRQNDPVGIHSTNGSLEMVTEFLKSNYDDIKTLPMNTVMPIAFEFDKNFERLMDHAHQNNDDPVGITATYLKNIISSLDFNEQKENFKEKSVSLSTTSSDLTM